MDTSMDTRFPIEVDRKFIEAVAKGIVTVCYTKEDAANSREEASKALRLAAPKSRFWLQPTTRGARIVFDSEQNNAIKL